MTRCAAAGFTLIELLVTTALLSLLVLLLFGGLHFGVRAWDGAQAHGERTDTLRVAQNLLRREIEQAYPAYDGADPTHPVVDFDGAETSMTFLAPEPRSVGTTGRARIAILRERDGGEWQLTMRADGWSAPLLRQVGTIRFSYFDGDRWNSRWSGIAAMPRLVRIHIDFPRGDGRIWPDLIVAPRISVDVACVYDAGTKRCQGRP